MNKLLILLVLTILLLFACDKESSRIHCKYKIDEPTTVKLYEVKAFSYKFIDSVNVKPNSGFTFRVNTEQTAFYQIYARNFEAVNLLISPGSKTNVDIYNDERSVRGSKDNVILTAFYDSLSKAKKELNELEKQYELAGDSLKPIIEETYKNIIYNHKRYSKGLVIENLNSLICIPVLYQQLVGEQFLFDRSKDLQFFKLAVDSLQIYYPHQRNVNALVEDFNSRLLDFNRYKILQSIDKMDTLDFPDITYNDINGKAVSLSKLNKSHVLLFFWSPTNPNCMELIPYLTRVYNTFKDKGFTIYAVHVGKDEALWKRSIQIEEIPWINVSDTLFEKSQTRLFYNINSIPSNVLINPIDKTIIAKDLTIKQLDSYLQDVSD